MVEKIEFTSNHHDHSNDNGFQFEFMCERCGSGIRTSFQPYAAGGLKQLFDMGRDIFGGALGRASSIADKIHSAGWEKARDKAFQNALAEAKPHFIQCPKCMDWVCRDKCWNEKKGLCKHCAPDLGVEMAAAQAQKSVEEVWAHAAMAEEDKKLGKEHWREGITAMCPQCEKPLATNAKFCPECGYQLKKKEQCECGTKLEKGAKFCPECGKKV